MQYEIIFYAGLIGTVVTLIITIIAFFKCNVVENVTDLLGGKLKSSKSIADNKKKKKKTSNKLKSNNKLESNNNTETQNNHKSENISEKEIVTASNNDEKRVNKSSTNVLGNKSKMYHKPEDIESEDSNFKKSVDLENDDLAMLNEEDDGTIMLSNEDDDATGILEEDKDATGILEDEDDATGILNDEDDATGILEDDDLATQLLDDEDDGFNNDFKNEISILITHIDMEI